MSQLSPTHGPFGSFGFESLIYGGEHIALLAKQRITVIADELDCERKRLYATHARCCQRTGTNDPSVCYEYKDSAPTDLVTRQMIHASRANHSAAV